MNAAKAGAASGQHKLQAEALTFGSHDEALEAFHGRGWTDGLPVLLPTEQRVRAMIAGAGRPAADVIGLVPPRWAEATVENMAINAVMAGCLPEHMPVLVGALQAACDPAFGLYGIQATTHPCGILIVVTGPEAARLKLNAGFGCFGPGNRANASIGRALRLVLVNVGGAIPGQGDMSTQGSPGKYSYCTAENEGATPWEPLRVALGYGREDSTVSVFAAESPHNVNDHQCLTAHTVLSSIASVMATIGNNNASCIDSGDVLVVLGPEHAQTVAAGGMTLRDIQRFLFDRARNTVGLLRPRAQWSMARWPKWINQENDATLVPLVGQPEDIHILVAGGAGKHSSFIPTFGVTKSVTKRIEPQGR
jgi:hypothetical protein